MTPTSECANVRYCFGQTASTHFCTHIRCLLLVDRILCLIFFGNGTPFRRMLLTLRRCRLCTILGPVYANFSVPLLTRLCEFFGMVTASDSLIRSFVLFSLTMAHPSGGCSSRFADTGYLPMPAVTPWMTSLPGPTPPMVEFDTLPAEAPLASPIPAICRCRLLLLG
jgi:hypothetical protein